ncbi:MAG: DMT family transporter [Bacteroidales bacterium]|nr:DMT family transporter [Bacteroidales bacterium]
MSDRTIIKGHAAMLGANTCWGLMAPVAKLVMAGAVISPLMLTDCRIVGAALLFWVMSFFSRREHVPARDLALLAGAGMLGILFNQGCYIFGVGFTSPGEASIITTTMPMWVMVLSRVLLGTPVTGRKIAGILLGATGAVTLIYSSVKVTVSGNNPVLGDLLVLTAQFSYALYLTLYKDFLRKYSMVTLMKWMFTFAAAAIIPFSIQTAATTAWASLSATEWAGVAYVVVMGTFVAYILMMAGQKALPPTVVGIYNYFQPVVATCVGLWLGLDVMTPFKGLAMLFIFSGVFLVTTAGAPRRQQVTALSFKAKVTP